MKFIFLTYCTIIAFCVQIQAQVFAEDYEHMSEYYPKTSAFFHEIYTVITYSDATSDTITSRVFVSTELIKIIDEDMVLIQNKNGKLVVYHGVKEILFDSTLTATTYHPKSFAGVDAYPALQEFATDMKLVAQTDSTHIYECEYDQGIYTKIRYEFNTVHGLFTKQEFFYNQMYYPSQQKLEIILKVMPESCIESVDFSFDSYIRALNKTFEPIEKFAEYSFSIVSHK